MTLCIKQKKYFDVTENCSTSLWEVEGKEFFLIHEVEEDIYSLVPLTDTNTSISSDIYPTNFSNNQSIIESLFMAYEITPKVFDLWRRLFELLPTESQPGQPG